MRKIGQLLSKVKVNANNGAVTVTLATGTLQPNGRILPENEKLQDFEKHLCKLREITEEDFVPVTISRDQGVNKDHLIVGTEDYKRESIEKSMEAAVIGLFKQTEIYKDSPESYAHLFQVIDLSHARKNPATCTVPTLLTSLEEVVNNVRIVKAQHKAQIKAQFEAQFEENNTNTEQVTEAVSNNNAAPDNPSAPGNPEKSPNLGKFTAAVISNNNAASRNPDGPGNSGMPG